MTQQAAAAIGIYAALNVLILLWLTLATSQLRGRYKVLVGDNGVPHLIRIMRGHANAVENMPMMMVLMLVAALLGTPVLVLHLLGVTFTVGRALHAWHFILEKGENGNASSVSVSVSLPCCWRRSGCSAMHCSFWQGEPWQFVCRARTLPKV